MKYSGGQIIEQQEMLQAALQYLECGLSIIPCRLWFEEGESEKAKKKPLFKWKDYIRRRPTEEEVVGWFREGDAQIGVVTGAISGIMVIDIDLGASDEQIKSLRIPPTLISNTPNSGHHLFFRMPQGILIPSKTDLLGNSSHIDIRADNAFAVLPPSKYPDGRQYSWSESFNLSAIVDLPDHLIKLLCEPKNRIKSNIALSANEIPQGADKGSRNDYMTSYIGSACVALDPNKFEKIAWPAMVGVNTLNRPPLPADELRDIFNSITTTELTQRKGSAHQHQLQPVLWGDFVKQPFSNIKWRVRDLVPAEGNTIIAAPSGEKKTWFVLDIARCIATGTPFLGKFEVTQGKVLYIDAEMSKSELLKRGKQLGLPDDVHILRVDELKIATDENIEWLKKYVKEHGITTVIIDTFRGVAGGISEEKAELIRPFFEKFKPFKDLGVAFIFLDHCRKPMHFEGKIPQKVQLFGSQDKVGNIEMLIMIRSDDESEDIQCYIRKNRVSKIIDPFKMKMTDCGDGDNVRTVLSWVGDIEVVKEIKKEEGKKLIPNILLEQGKKTRKEIEEIGKLRGVGIRNMSAAIKELSEEGGIVIDGKVGRANFYNLPKDREEGSLFQQ